MVSGKRDLVCPEKGITLDAPAMAYIASLEFNQEQPQTPEKHHWSSNTREMLLGFNPV
jgi:hypothetical protein